ncbi:hypothetical protein V1460_05165 [Streptomyces sp. SCSIO 30461]|uniref:hypothetical protein n=1 Tax=Streptomyces sp. SCSIO 30461 TaxID=3118085 RepID=UPI0030D2EAC0
MARHAKPRQPRLRAAGLTVTVSAIGAAIGGGAGVAQAAEHAEPAPALPAYRVADLEPAPAVGALTGATGAGAVGNPVRSVPLNPLAHTPVDPLNNGVGTQIADFKPVDTRQATGSLGHVPDVPVAGPMLGGLGRG